MLDFYCERTGPGLWDEPLNTLTNLAYVAAALGVWRAGRIQAPGLGRVLAWLLVAIGAGSAAFHVLATPWARLLDETPILVFQLTFLWAYGRLVMALPGVLVAGLLVVFLGAVLALRPFSEVLNGSLPYVPALLAAVILGVYHFRTQLYERTTLLAAVACVAAALQFRIMDPAVCDRLPTGTHFLWHVLTAAALYLVARGLLAAARAVPTVSSRPR